MNAKILVVLECEEVTLNQVDLDVPTAKINLA